ncbi:MAG TPA: DUF3857 domain-containing protein [Pyrinomonadaceae bacterium]
MKAKLAMLVCFCAGIVSLTAANAWADEPPNWLVEAAKLPTPAYDVRDVPAVVLRNEEVVSVGADGTIITTDRIAIRVLTCEGRDYALARAVYETDSEKVTDINAWLVRKTGPMKIYGKKETVDMILADNALYNDARKKFISGYDDADVGDVFAYETVVQSKQIFSQFQFDFQENLPVVWSGFQLGLPDGWKADAVTLNRAKIEPVVSGNSYSWQLQNLPPIKPESQSPGPDSLAPRLAVSFFPPAGSSSQFRTFANWNDVARWMSELEDPQATVDDALAAKARDLAAGAQTELERINAIGRYVQKIQYISIQIGLGRGGGYVPHSATEVFAKSYGDCKDKANLMRAMLSALKIQAYLVSITADDPSYVRAEWASPHQFNHCIVAIKIGDDTKADAVVTHPKLGRLLIFDPTDPYTPVGDLPEPEQGSFALIDNKDTDALLTMPVSAPEKNRLERNIEVSLDPAGAISGTIAEKSTGPAATLERARLRELSNSAYNESIERWIANGAAGAKVTKITPTDDPNAGNFDLNVEFSANSYAQIMQDHLMVFKPAIISRLERLSFTEGKRMSPYMIDSSAYSESVRIKLPTGFDVDEVPDRVHLESPFGKYNATYEVSGGYLVFTRALQLSRTLVPAAEYDSVRNFFGRIRAAEQSPVVLVKK